MKPKYQVESVVEVDKVPASFPVQFSLLTTDDRQYVAYYDQNKRMTVAMRHHDSADWTYQSLPSVIGWDSHNYVTMATDSDHQLHVSGNMHCDDLVYFRTTTAGDISTLTEAKMTGELETRVTYPRFLTSSDGQLIFNYRHGGSGNGIHIYNQYDSTKDQWTRLIDIPLLDGQDLISAYPTTPVLGPDGLFHMLWVWRDSPDCATNHHLSYACSSDLIHWESVFGQPADLPITLHQECLWVDPIPTGGGILNGCAQLRFNSSNQPVITYHKNDQKGDMQVYAARPEGSVWQCSCLTKWQTPIHFGGEGSKGFIGIQIGALEAYRSGISTLAYEHRDYGHGHLFIDDATLQPLEMDDSVSPNFSVELQRVESDFPGVEIQRAFDSGETSSSNSIYMLQWEALPRNGDKERFAPLPEPARLRLYKLVKNTKA